MKNVIHYIDLSSHADDKSSYEYWSDFQQFQRKLCMSSETVWNLVNCAQLTYILRVVSEPWSADIGESPF